MVGPVLTNIRHVSEGIRIPLHTDCDDNIISNLSCLAKIICMICSSEQTCPCLHALLL